MRTGTDYLAALKDDREIYIDGQRVHDVASHPAFAPIAATVAELFDLAADPATAMTYTAPETGDEANLVHSIPRSQDDLASRRRAIQTWARHTHGWVGRGPDHIGSFLAGFAAHPEAFAAEPHDLAANVVSYYRRLLRESLFVSSALIPPQVSRATTAHGWDGEFIQAGVAAERPDGIVIRGAQMLATGAAVADEIFVSCIKPLTPQDRDFAVSFTVPVAAAGLKLYCRRPYAPAASSRYDYPLSTRYDETDALVVFGDVLVPWERVFVDRDVAGLRRQFFDTGAHVLGNWQAQIRFVVKLQFILGLARKIAAVNGTDMFPGVQERLGELASIASLIEAGVLAAEYQAAPDRSGLWRHRAPRGRGTWCAPAGPARRGPPARREIRRVAKCEWPRSRAFLPAGGGPYGGSMIVGQNWRYSPKTTHDHGRALGTGVPGEACVRARQRRAPSHGYPAGYSADRLS